MTELVTTETEQDAERPNILDRVRLGIPLALGVVVAVFVALGIEGDVRDRVIRNSPVWVSIAFALAMVGLALPLLIPAVPGKSRHAMEKAAKRNRRFGIVGGLVLLSGAGVAVFIGAQGLSVREHPTLSIGAGLIDPSGGVVRVDVIANAPTLRSNEKMLVRVAAVRLPALKEAKDLCLTPEPLSAQWPPQGLVDRLPRIDEPVRVLFFGESGPNTKGQASTSVSVQAVRTEFSHICVYVALLNRRGEGRAGDRYVWGQVDLRTAPPSAS